MEIKKTHFVVRLGLAQKLAMSLNLCFSFLLFACIFSHLIDFNELVETTIKGTFLLNYTFGIPNCKYV